MGGRNIYPTDIERAAGQVEGVRAAWWRYGSTSDTVETFAVAVELFDGFEDPPRRACISMRW